MLQGQPLPPPLLLSVLVPHPQQLPEHCITPRVVVTAKKPFIVFITDFCFSSQCC
jgi:hypothetical protein